MRGTDDPVTAARRGVFSLWTEAVEARPVFEMVKASQATQRPIEMAGFDMQVTANGSTERYGLELKAFASALRHTATRERASALATAVTDARRRCFTTNFASSADFEALTTAATDLQKLIRSQATQFEAVWGAAYTAFIDRTVGNARADAAQRFEAARSPKTTPERENRRDALNAENLRWLLEECYPRRKAVIWAHNVHVMKAWYSADFRDVHIRAHARDMKPTGVFLSEWLGRQAYSLGMTAYEGSEGMAVGGPVSAIAPAQGGTLEAQLHALGFPYAFLNLRAVRQPVAARFPKFETTHVEDPSRVFDGILFIDRMSRATRA
jgi:erythromycin esterase